MSSKIPLQTLLTFAIKAGLTDTYEAAKIAQFAPIDPDALRGRPDLEQQKKYYDQRAEELAQHPTVQASIQPAAGPALSAQRHQPAAVARSMINQAWANPGQQPAPQPQRQQLTQRGPQVSVQADPTLTAISRNLQRAIDELPGRITAAVAKSAPARQQKAAIKDPAPVRKSQVEPRQTEQVVWRGPGGSTLTRVNIVKETKASHSTGLSVSPFTGQPSELTTMIRRQYGLK